MPDCTIDGERALIGATVCPTSGRYGHRARPCILIAEDDG